MCVGTFSGVTSAGIVISSARGGTCKAGRLWSNQMCQTHLRGRVTRDFRSQHGYCPVPSLLQLDELQTMDCSGPTRLQLPFAAVQPLHCQCPHSETSSWSQPRALPQDTS